MTNDSAAEPLRAAEVLRILDANANRAGEGLRVVEECVRFLRNDATLTQLLKQLRHDLASALEPIPRDQRLRARDTEGDVGTQLSTTAERERRNAEHIAAAGLKRTQEALRVIEEFSKLHWPHVSSASKQLRYRVYHAEKLLLSGAAVRGRFAAARLYVLIDGGPNATAFGRLAESLVEAGVDVLQLRDKQLDDRPLLERARQLRAITRGSPTLFVMNDRPDLAVLAEADGIHVGQEELGVADVRRIVGAEMAIGVSTHSVEQIRAAVLDGAEYLGCGPTFPSATKSFREFTGVELLAEAARITELPVFAIGGIQPDNLPQVLATGIRRIAVSHAVCGAPDPAGAARLLRRLLDEYSRST